MECFDYEAMQKVICDDDVTAAIRDAKLSVTLTADDLRTICAGACRHAKTRGTSLMSVRDAMTREVLSVGKFDEISRAVKLLAENNVSGLPVVDRENRVVGIISEADVVAMVGSSRKHTFRDYVRHLFGHNLPERKMGSLVGDIMTAAVVTIQPDVELSEAVRLMDQRRIRRLPVIDKNGRLIGLISRSNIVKAMGKRLPPEA